MAAGPRANPADEANVRLERILSKIRSQVVGTLGEQDCFQHIQVRRLWENRYRVNVLAGSSSLCVEILHSFFVISDDEGTILTSLPEMSGSIEVPHGNGNREH